MLKLRAKRTHNEKASAALPTGQEVHDYHIEQIFLGHHTIFTLLGLIIGGDLIGRTIYDYINTVSSPLLTLTLGLLIFTLSGILVGSFKD